MNARAGERGLTLVELLVALLVFSFVASAAVLALRLGVEARDQLELADDRLSQFEIARLMLKDDLAQLVNRPVRDEFGDTSGAMFRGGEVLRLRNPVEGERRLMAFVRAGWANPGATAPRSSLQYVEYLEKDGALVRRIRPFLDDARDQPEFDRVLIDGVSGITVSFLQGNARGALDWADRWPPAAGAPAPEAIALDVTDPRFGEVRQMFWIGKIGGAQ